MLTPRLIEMSPAKKPGFDQQGSGQERVSAVALVLHGGSATSRQRTSRMQLSYLRMVPFARDLYRKAGADGLAVWLLRYRFRGWNAPELDAVQDARWALAEIRSRHPEVPVALVGHSLGGRVVLRVADDAAVRSVCALAPWTEPDEPVTQLTGRTVLIAHGDRERWTDPKLSYEYAVRAKQVTDRVCRFDVHGDTHAMLRRASEWTALVRGFVLGSLEFAPMPDSITAALMQPSPHGLAVPLGVAKAPAWQPPAPPPRP